MKSKIIEFIDKNSGVVYIFLAFCIGLIIDYVLN